MAPSISLINKQKKILNKLATQPKPNPIIKQFQQLYSNAVLPIQIDGLLGPETNKAATIIKQKLQHPNNTPLLQKHNITMPPNLSWQQLNQIITKIRQNPELNSKMFPMTQPMSPNDAIYGSP